MRMSVLSSLAAACLALAGCPAAAGDNVIVTSPTPQITEVTVTDEATFNEPWAMTFLPGSAYALITEKAGKLKLWRKDRPVRDVAGAPAVAYGGQGGFGDVVPAPDYRTSRMIYLSWVEAGINDTRGAVVGRAKLDLAAAGGPRLVGLKVIWRQGPKLQGEGHFSHRIAFSPDGQYMFVSSGERQRFTPAQNLKVNLGKILRLLPDGRPAPGNPFADKPGAGRQIWSYGHRNALGLAFDTKGQLWDLEHGPKGGDELNFVKPGKNYGWPLVSNGDNYDGTPIPRHATRPDLEAPAISWNPVIAPGDLIFYKGNLFPGWKGHAICTGMVAQALVRVATSGERGEEIERIPLGSRIREIKEAPDGSLYILEDGSGGRLRRIVPAKAGS
ncbi:PQQ-dependent sugar dehydrogenase [Novosphingobium fuchskuhlense]